MGKESRMTRYDADNPLTVISLGAGVQSSALLMLAANGELPDSYDQPTDAIFADTGDEPPSVYRWLEKLSAIADRSGIRLHTVSAGVLSEAVLEGRKGAGIPAFVANQEGRLAMSSRACTSDYKIAPIRRKVRELIGAGPRGRVAPKSVHMLIGISTDEVGRAKTSRVDYIINRYPLLDLRISRNSVKIYVENQGMGTPPRSACVFCPYRSNDEWRQLRDAEPDAFRQAVEFDESLRLSNRIRREAGESNATKGDPFVHRSLLPLSQVDLSTPEENGQGSLFGNECEGMCGV